MITDLEDQRTLNPELLQRKDKNNYLCTKKASSGLMETKIIFFPGRYDSIRDRQLILERPWKEARSPGQAVAVGTEHKDPQVPKEDNRGFLWEPGSTVLFWSATNCDSFTVSVRAAGFLWEVTRTLISLISL